MHYKYIEQSDNSSWCVPSFYT